MKPCYASRQTDKQTERQAYSPQYLTPSPLLERTVWRVVPRRVSEYAPCARRINDRIKDGTDRLIDGQTDTRPMQYPCRCVCGQRNKQRRSVYAMLYYIIGDLCMSCFHEFKTILGFQSCGVNLPQSYQGSMAICSRVSTEVSSQSPWSQGKKNETRETKSFSAVRYAMIDNLLPEPDLGIIKLRSCPWISTTGEGFKIS